MDPAPPDRYARLADAAILALACGLFWQVASEGHDDGLAPAIALGVPVLLGLIARVADVRGARWLAITMQTLVALGVVVLTDAYASAFQRADTFAWIGALALVVLGLPALALAGLASGARFMPFVLGVGMAALATRSWVPVGLGPLVAIAFVVARHAFATTGEPARQRLASLGAGACAGLAAAGLGFDLFARATHWGYAVEPFSSAAWRIALELAVVVGALHLARGRTHGLLVVGLAGAALACALSDAAPPHWGGECYPVFHPLIGVQYFYRGFWALYSFFRYDTVLAFALPLAVVPWALPFARALVRAARSAPHESDLGA